VLEAGLGFAAALDNPGGFTATASLRPMYDPGNKRIQS